MGSSKFGECDSANVFLKKYKYMEKIPPELIKKLNDKSIQELDEKIYFTFNNGSPESRRNKMRSRLLKKLNEKEYIETQKNKRKSSRF